MNKEMEQMILDATKNECFLKNDILNGLNEIDVKIYSNTKKLIINVSQISDIEKFIELFTFYNVDLKRKLFVIDISNYENGYMTTEQCKSLFFAREKLQEVGAELKLQDGSLWDLEDVLVANNQIDEIVNKIQNTVIEDKGVNRPLNELEKFMWIYKFVTNREYSDCGDVHLPRAITSILNGTDIVCVGFANLLKVLCFRVGIECYKNVCLADGIAHANNIVVINKVPYYCDACWDCKKDRDSDPSLNYCLIPCSDVDHIKYQSISDCKAPFFDVEQDLKAFTQELKEIESKQSFSSEEYEQFKQFGYDICGTTLRENYFSLVPPYTGDNNNYKDKACYYLREIIKLLKERKKNSILSIDDIQYALENIYIAQGNNRNNAKRLANLNVKNAVAETHIIYNENAKNCFVNEPYKLHSITL